MKFSAQIPMLFLLATAVSAITPTGYSVHARDFGLSRRQNEPPVIEREECTRLVDDGFGNTNRKACNKSEEGVNGCTCRINRTQVRCIRVVEDGTGNSNIVTCQRNEEGVNGCSCSETTATKKVIRCIRVRDDGTGNSFIESCERREEGVNGCECSETIDVL